MARRTPPGPKVYVFSSRRPSLKRAHLGLYVGLTALVVAALAVHGLRAGPGEAVPVTAPPPQAVAPGPGRSSLSGYLSSRALSYLRAALPLLSLQDEGLPRSWLPDPDRLVDALVRLLGGVDLADPRTFLRLQVPLMVYADLPAASARAPGPVLPDGPASGQPLPPVVTTAGRDAEGPIRVAIYHTHAQEAYLPAMYGDIAGRRPQEAFSLDPEVGVLRVGLELVGELRGAHAVGAVQDRTVYDREGRLSSYERSALGVARLLQSHPHLQVMLDIHRDEGRRANTTIEIAGQAAARVLIVVGTDRNLAHPDWRQNYALARRMVALMEEMYPGLSMGIRDKENRYNQHLFPGLLLVEVGCQENSLPEALHTARLLAAVVARMVDEGRGGP
ncbi:MAG: stage II sporulation protein P [bacterium]|nr:stage II sporulation protein P [bacterium]